LFAGDRVFEAEDGGVQGLAFEGLGGGGCALEGGALAVGAQPAVFAIGLVAEDGRAWMWAMWTRIWCVRPVSRRHSTRAAAGCVPVESRRPKVSMPR
jgi:hypothetical protein